MKKIFPAFLLSCIMALIFMSPVMAAEIVDSGDCSRWNSNVTWTLDSDGVLTISGNGDMGYFLQIEKRPYHKYISKITSIKIEDGVTSIGLSAFEDCVNVTSVSIADSVIEIGTSAFENCTNLKEIDMPDTAESINSYAFRDCARLTTITVPDGVVKIEDRLFYGCKSLSSVILPESLMTIGDNAFSGCEKLTTIEIPSEVTTIGDWAFSNCSGLTTITAPNHLLIIENFAFYQCKSLKSVYFDGNVPSKFGGDVFYDTHNDFTIYYYEDASGWTTPTWTSDSGDTYNTKMICRNHVLQYIESTANCMGTGYPEYWTCEKCGLNFSDESGTQEINLTQEAYDADNHTGGVEIRNKKASSASENGYTGYIYCLGCGVKLQSGTDIIASSCSHESGHVYQAAVQAKTMNSAAKVIHTCIYCGTSYEEYIQDITISVSYTGSSSSTINGYGTYTHYYDVSATGGYGTLLYKVELYQNDTPVDETTFSTNSSFLVSNKGYYFNADNKVMKISVKDDYGHYSTIMFRLSDETIYDIEVLSVDHEHNEGAWIIDAQPTCNKAGLKHTECSVCGITVSTAIIPITSAVSHTGGTELRHQSSTYTGDTYCLGCGALIEKGTEIYIPGDLNHDGDVNIMDVLLLLQSINGYDVNLESSADFNGDSSENILDVILLLQYINGYSVTLK